MAQKEFNTIIGQIEEDLKKLQSAKEQVEKIVTENTAFSEKATELILNTDQLLSVLKEDTNGISNSFVENLSESKKQLEKLIKDSQTGIYDIHKSLKDEHDEMLQSVKSKIDEALTLSANTLNSAKNILEEQKSENLKTLNQILETHNQIKQLIGQLWDLKIPETLKNINENLENLNNFLADFRKEVADIESDNQKRFKLTKALQISILIVSGVFGIVIVLKLFGVIQCNI